MNHVPIIPASTSPGPHPNPTRQVLRHLTRLAVAVVIVGLPGCGLSSPEEPEHRVIGIIHFNGTMPEPRIPRTATAGVPLEMAIWTGGGACYRQGDTEVAVNGRAAVVTPYDLFTIADRDCPDDGWCGTSPHALFDHRVTVVFEEPGTAEVALVYSTGLDWYDPDGHEGDGRRVFTVEVSPAG